MRDLKNVDRSLTDTIRNSNLKDLSVDTVENFIDSTLKDGILKDIPILATVIGIGNTMSSIKNALFLKKIISFLSNIADVAPDQRRKMVDSIDESQKYKMKVGEKLVYIIDKCDDHMDAKYVAQLFNAFVEEKISYDEFLRGSRIIQDIFLADLEYFLSLDITEFEVTGSSEEFPHEDQFPLINVGICGFGYDRVTLQKAYLHSDEQEIRGGDAVVWVTSIGKKLKEVLRLETN